MQQCKHCHKQFKDSYIGGIRDSTNWGEDVIICGSCYNSGVEQ